MASESDRFKETLNLPKTDFPMKAKLPDREPEIIKKWEQNKIYEKMIRNPGGAFKLNEQISENKAKPDRREGKHTTDPNREEEGKPREPSNLSASQDTKFTTDQNCGDEGKPSDLPDRQDAKGTTDQNCVEGGKLRESSNLPTSQDAKRTTDPNREEEGKPGESLNLSPQRSSEESQKKPPVFFLLDGPIYSNGDLHLGHVLNKILKDIVIKYKNLSGCHAPFIPTWDCHGLPIEMKALKQLKDTNRPAGELRELCRKTSKFWIEKQKDSFRRLGILAGWDDPVLTMDPSYEAEETRVLATIAERGLLVRGRKPVLWCFKLKTALAFSEAEYRSHQSPSIYVKFPLTDESRAKLSLNRPASLVIWTTTPWTLPANAAVCLHGDFEYGLYEENGELYVTAQALKESFEKETGRQLLKCVKTFKGREWEKLKVKNPLTLREVPVILGPHVTLESGTGCVHTAPGHGLEDYTIGKKYSLPESCPVDERGCFTEDAPKDLKGLFIFKGNKVILDTLKSGGRLLSAREITHSYPYNPRSNSPLIYRLTPQWFLKLDDPKHPVRSTALRACEKNIRFVPPWGRVRLEGMLKSGPDWCLSRQRFWGVPLIVFYCKACEKPLLNPSLMRQIADQMEQTGQGMEYYFSKTEKELIPLDLKCDFCGEKNFKKGSDILDVWFDSGVEHAVFKKKGLPFPADLYLEGSDQHRGWFQTSLISSLALNFPVKQKYGADPARRGTPFKTLLTHGFVNDLQGQKMSKSKGNIKDPAVVIREKGAEILRLWTASEDYSKDVSAGGEIFQRMTDTYRRFRNTLRFMLGNLNDFDSKALRTFSDLSPVDQWALIQLNKLIQECRESFESYAFHKIYHCWSRFFTVTLSSFYLDIIKDRLYTFGKNSNGRRQTQTVLYHTLDRLLPLMAPITTFLSEEAYSFFPGKKRESVLLETISPPHGDWRDSKIEQLFERLFPLRDKLNKQLETLREIGKIGSSLQAQARLKVSSKFFPVKMSHRELCEFFSVSKVTLEETKPGERPMRGPVGSPSQAQTSGESISPPAPAAKEEALSDSSAPSVTADIEAFPAQGDKCLRCWFYSDKLSNEICPKCVENLM